MFVAHVKCWNENATVETDGWVTGRGTVTGDRKRAAVYRSENEAWEHLKILGYYEQDVIAIDPIDI